jgi:outer membrane protein OmpA-like peptidoglycan-associated protein
MRWKPLAGVLVVVVGLAGSARAWEGHPAVEADVGAAIPTGDTQRSADVGGALAVSGGYRFSLFDDSFGVTLLGEPFYAAMPTAGCGGTDQRPCRSSEGDVTGVFALTGGARFSLIDGPIEVYFAAKGGYYNATSGSLKGEAAGFNIAGGLSYEFLRGMSIGAFIRRDQAGIDAATDSSSSLQFLVTALSFQYRFLPELPAAEAPPPPPPAPPAAPVKQRIVLRGVNFDFDKADIRADARPILDEAIATLKQKPGIRIAVDGYTDDIGSDAYNQKLSLERAHAVERYLAAGGIAADRMEAFGFGESKPVASNETADGRAQNRRVELRIIAGE